MTFFGGKLLTRETILLKFGKTGLMKTLRLIHAHGSDLFSSLPPASWCANLMPHCARTSDCIACCLSFLGDSEDESYKISFSSWIFAFVYSAGRARSSVDSWYYTALDVEKS